MAQPLHERVVCMPELPEVELLRTHLSALVCGSAVTAVHALERGGGPREGLLDDRVLRTSPSDLTRVLQGARVTGTGRRGKHTWLELAGGALAFHLGMSGWLHVKGRKALLELESSKAGGKGATPHATWPPRFTKLTLEFSNGVEIAFTDPRRLGRVQFFANLTKDLLTNELGDMAPDPLTHMPTLDEFAARMSSAATGTIKAALLDQRALVCGVGNYLADDILRCAKIHPESTVKALVTHSDAVAQLHQAIAHVIQVCCQCLQAETDFPPDFLFHHRWGKAPSQDKPRALGLQEIQVAGRTTLLVRGLQVKYTAAAAAAAATPTTAGSAGSGAPKRARRDEN